MGQILAGRRGVDLLQALGRTAVEHLPALRPCTGPDVHDPVRVVDDIEVMLDDEQRVAGGLESIERSQQRFGVGRMQAGRRLVEHVHDAEQVRPHLRGQPQSLQLAGRERRRAAIERQVAESEVEQHRDAPQQVLADALRHEGPLGMRRRRRATHAPAVRGRPEPGGEVGQRQARHLGDVEAGEGHRQRVGPQALALARRAVGADQVPRHAPLHRRALGGGKRLQDVPACARERAHVAGRVLARERAPDLVRLEAGVDGHGRLLLREQQPVAGLARQVAPRRVDVVAERDRDVAQVLPVPRGGPGRDGPLADGEPIVGHHRRLGRVVHPPQSVATRARAVRRVGREVIGMQHRLPCRIVARPRIQHPHQVRQRRHAADRRSRRGGAALLLERDGGRQALDGVDVGDAELVEEPARIGRDRLEVATLRLGVERAERERGRPRPRDAREHHQRVARDVHVDVLQVVLARAAHPDAVTGCRHGRSCASGHPITVAPLAGTRKPCRRVVRPGGATRRTPATSGPSAIAHAGPAAPAPR